MNLSLNSFRTKDGLVLPGLLYTPTKKTSKVVIWLHGCGSSSVFYSVDRMNVLGKLFTDNGISFFPFNNRGAHIVKSLKRISDNNDGEAQEEKVLMGTAYELIRECELDIEGALDYLEGLGYKEFYLVGHSTGANKICVYNYYKPENRISKYILLAGGDDTGLYFQQLGKQKYQLALNRCKEEIEKGNGMKIVPQYLSQTLYSYQSFYDVINPDGDYNVFPFFEYSKRLLLTKIISFRHLKKISKPTLVLYGENDEFTSVGADRAVEILQKELKGLKNYDYKVIPEADHNFTAKDSELATIITSYLS